LSEEAQVRLKSMVEFKGGVQWSGISCRFMVDRGFVDVTLAPRYKGERGKDYFLHYHARQRDLAGHLRNGHIDYSNSTVEDWRVTLVDTGASTMTRGVS